MNSDYKFVTYYHTYIHILWFTPKTNFFKDCYFL